VGRPAVIDSSDRGISVKGFCNPNPIVSGLPTIRELSQACAKASIISPDLLWCNAGLQGCEETDHVRCLIGSKAVAQRELHDAGLGQCGCELSERNTVGEEEITTALVSAVLQ